MIRIKTYRRLWHDEDCGAARRGSFMTLGLFCLVACMTFVAFSVDVGMISLTQTRMQNAVDSAALAAAMEITYAVENAGEDVDDVILYAQTQAAAKAVEVAALNGVYVDPTNDVYFGHRSHNDATGEWSIQWGATPSNVVKVVARRDNDDVTAPDGKLQLLFAGVNGDDSATIKSAAVAYVEARDIVTVLDFSRSMNFDSFFASEYENPSAYMPQAELEANMLKVWQDLGSPQWGNMGWTPNWVTIPGQPEVGPIPHIKVTFKGYSVDIVSTKDLSNVVLEFFNGNKYKFDGLTGKTGTFQGTGSNNGQLIKKCWVKSGTNASSDGPGYGEKFDFYDNNTIKKGLGLVGVPYPYPVGSWDNFIEMCRDHSSSMTSYYQSEVSSKGYRRKFGAMLMIQYLLRFEPGHWETPDLWKTRHYPFTSVKNGEKLFCEFLDDLSFGDQLGLVSYDTSHRVETTLSGAGLPTVNIAGDPISEDYDAVWQMIHHKQAAHYNYATNMGGGLKDAKWLLDNHKRAGARPTILLMTDGNTNTMDSGESSSLPAGWNWDTLFDYDDNGVRDYETSNSQKRYLLKVAKQCVDNGFTIHTMSVGADADRDLMEAIAWLGRGIYIEVPGGTSVTEMEDDVKEAFRRIAAFVPPAKLLNPAE